MKYIIQKLFLVFCVLFSAFSVNAQTTFVTNYTSTSPYYFNAGAGYVTFTLTNNNPFTVLVTQVAPFHLPVYTENVYELWYSATSLNGTGYPIANPTWTQIAVAEQPITTTTQTVVYPFKCINFPIPPNTTYRFALVGSSGIMFRQNAGGFTTTPSNFTLSGVTMGVGDELNAGLPVGRAGVMNLGLVYTNPAYYFGEVSIAPQNTYNDIYISQLNKPSTICNQANSFIGATICNRGTQSIDFATNNVNVSFTINGPGGPQVTNASITSGSLAPCNCTNALVTGVNYSQGGQYNVTATATLVGLPDANTADNIRLDTLYNYKPTVSGNDSICQYAPVSSFVPFSASGCMSKNSVSSATMTFNPVLPIDGNSDASAGLDFATGILPVLPPDAVVTGAKLRLTNLRNTSPSKANEPRFNIYGPAPNGPANPLLPGVAGNPNAFTYYKFNYEVDLTAAQINNIYSLLGAGNSFSLGYWESIDDLPGVTEIQLNAQTYQSSATLQIFYTVTPVAKWYTALSGGVQLGSGSSFHPFYATGGIPNTNTPGATTYFVACNNDTACRVPVTVTIKPSPTVNKDSIYACELLSSTGFANFDLTSVSLNVANNDPTASVSYYADAGLTSLINNPTSYNSSPNLVYSKVEVPGGCYASDSVMLFVNAKPDISPSLMTGFACAPFSLDVRDLINPFSTSPVGTDTLYYADAAYSIPHPNPYAINTTDTVYVVFVTNTTPSCADSASAYMEVAPVSNYILSQDTTFNYSIAGNAGCHSFVLADGMTDTLKSNSDCRRVAQIKDVPNSVSLGTVTVCQDVLASVPTHNGQPYVNRVYQITATNSDTAEVCLYYLNDDFDQYNAVAMTSTPMWPTLPLSPLSPSMANIAVSKVDNGDIFAPNHTVVAIPNSDITATYDAASTVWTVCFPVGGFSYFYLHAQNPGNVPLPVQLASFEAQKQGDIARLDWMTVQEQNNDYFVVERSRDGLAFAAISEAIMSKAPDGNSSTPLGYLYEDKSPMYGNNYYRLRQVDRDGNAYYSDTRLVNFSDNVSVQVYPNPTQDVLRVAVNSARAGAGLLRIHDATGKLIKVVNFMMQAGGQELQLDLSGVAAGMYLLSLSDQGGVLFSQPLRKL